MSNHNTSSGGSMILLALSIVILVAVNGNSLAIALAECTKNDRKCLSTLEDFKEAYFRGDYYRSDSGEWGYDAYYTDGRDDKQMGLTMGFYRLTYDSQETENSTHIKWGKCCYPSKDDNHCLVIIAFHSSVYNIFHPLLLEFLAMPFSPRFLLFGTGKIRALMRASSGVHCWNVPPVCSDRESTVRRSLIDFNLQLKDLALYGKHVTVGYPGFSADFHPVNPDLSCRGHHSYCDHKYTIVILPSAIGFVLGPLIIMFMNKHKRYIQDVTRQSTFARQLLYSLMITSLMAALYLLFSLAVSIYRFREALYSSQQFYPDYFWSDVVASIWSISLLTSTILIQLPFLFYYFWSRFSPKACNLLRRIVTSAGWCCVVVMLQVLSFYAFHAVVLCVVSLVATVARACFIMSLILSFITVLSVLFSLCQPPYCYFKKFIKVLLVILFAGIVNLSLSCITFLTGNPMAPSTQGVNVASLTFSAAASAILSVFVYFAKVFFQQKINRETKRSEVLETPGKQLPDYNTIH